MWLNVISCGRPRGRRQLPADAEIEAQKSSEGKRGRRGAGALPRWGRQAGGAGDTLGAHLFVRALGLVYFLAFLSLGWQIHGLVGPGGVFPFAGYLAAAKAQLGAGRLLAGADPSVAGGRATTRSTWCGCSARPPASWCCSAGWRRRRWQSPGWRTFRWRWWAAISWPSSGTAFCSKPACWRFSCCRRGSTCTFGEGSPLRGAALAAAFPALPADVRLGPGQAALGRSQPGGRFRRSRCITRPSRCRLFRLVGPPAAAVGAPGARRS